MNLSLYFGGDKFYRRRRNFWSAAMTSQVYASVVLDLQARELKDKLFTYKVPPALVSDTFIGAQVLVPFGHRDLVGGYVVSISDEANVDEGVTIKEIAEVVEPEPIFDKDYVEFLYWIADYYCSTLADVISAAVPSILAPKFKRIAKLEDAWMNQANDKVELLDPAAKGVVRILRSSANGSLALSVLRQRARKLLRLTPANFYRTLNLLRQESVVQLLQESSQGQAPKLLTAIVWTGTEGATARQKEIIQILSRNGGRMMQKDILEQASTTHATLKKMSDLNMLEIVQEESIRDPLKALKSKASETLTLSEAQAKAMEVLSADLSRTLESRNSFETQNKVEKDTPTELPEPWLLHGVTGSGKTEIYLRLIEQTLLKGRCALLLVPEISLTPQLARRLKGRFGDSVAIWHSALSDGERYDTWRRLKSGEVKVLLGARSAILANLPDLGLIILDEEHDGSYKQTSPSPRYNAKYVAREKARRSGAMVLFGSATPDVAVYAEAREKGRILELPERALKQRMPEVAIVDMRQEFANGNKSIFSRLLETRMAECFERKEQLILLLNRRGYASHVFCRGCGFVVKCKNCSVSLVFHQAAHSPNGKVIYSKGFLACHHCGFRCGAVESCPQCKGPFIKQFGLGTQRVEEEVKEKFPDVRILRLDSDVTQRKGAHDEVLQDFSEGGADVLIGTQMVAKGLDIHNVTLVGVLAADAAFNLPDYRSLERGFQLLTQVSGRAGRGDRPGSVVMQTYDTDMPILQWAKTHDYHSFKDNELEARQAFDYPPYSQLIRVVVSGPDAIAVQAACEKLAEQLSHAIEDELDQESLQVLGPAPCLIERLRGNFRYHLLLKNLAGEVGRSLITKFLRNKSIAPNVVMTVDVDALDLI